MNLLKLLEATGQQEKVVQTLATQFGLQGQQANEVLSQVMAALGGGVQQNIKQKDGLESLVGALQSGHHEKYVEQPDNAVNASDEGNKILGHILGNKEASRDIAQSIQSNTGVSNDIIKKMLPVIATIAMGTMSKNSGLQGGKAMPMAGQANGGIVGMLASMLDMDKDGSPVDDILKIVSGMRK